MKHAFLVFGVIMMAASNGAQERPRLAEAWETEYTGADANGEHVIALWQFNEGAETLDTSGKGHDCAFDGARLHPEGRFGSGLESYRGWPDQDTKHSAIVPHHPDLSPSGPFTIELWLKPKADLDGYPESFLIDKKYVSDNDYQIILSAADSQGQRRLRAVLGFGDGSETYYSNSTLFEANQWYHIAFIYDGNGGGRFVLNGRACGGAQYPARGSIKPGKHPLSIGDRIGSYYHGFPGVIDQVRLCRGALEFRRVGLALITRRRAYVRMEPAPPLRLEVTNLQPTPLAGATVRINLSGLAEQQFGLPVLEPGATHLLDYSLDTSLRPDKYVLRATVIMQGPSPYESEELFSIHLVPRPVPERMPVLMWGAGGGEIQRLKEIGFTHAIGIPVDYAKVWEAGAPTEAQDPNRLADTYHMLDEALVNGIRLCASLSPGSWARSRPEFRRIDRQGKPYEREDICGLFPQLREFCYNVGASVAQTYGEYPAFDCALIHTEVRDQANVCFHEHDRAACREATGLDIPDEVVTKAGVQWEELPDFPADRVIPDDHPLYRYFQWYWKNGDGWNDLNTAVHEGLKSTGRTDLWTFHDPAVRVAKVLGSGGKVDYLSQWTYSYPDPIRIATPTEELLTMVRHAPQPQDLMKMTQIIWYRSQTAPMSEASQQRVAAQSVWEDTDPDAAFITISPMHLRETFWTMLSRPVKGIMYHGWQSLVDCPGSTSSYRYTHPQTHHELTRLIREVVRPLGPTLRQVPEAKTDVALLQSFASEMFARRGTYGWAHTWIGDMYLILQWAHLQADILFDETLLSDGLDRYKVLVMPDCDVLTASVAARVKAFQAAGGIVVGDEHLCPAIQPDIVLPSYTRTKQADVDKQALQALAATLREQLDAKYSRYVDTSNPNVIPHYRRFGTTDYLFLINDHREFGDYVGHHGLVMEQGLPSQATVTIARQQGFAYDLVRARPVPVESAQGKLTIDTELEPCSGQLLMITERAIQAVRIEVPETAQRGESFEISITVTDAEGMPLDAAVPVKLDILDPNGREAEFSEYHSAVGGTLKIRCDLATNDTPGLWEIRAEERASGLIARRYVRVT
ncbi:MAG: LamG-like jellyroll fold domain-containing protein [Candidatus Zipacnadales bacterium]